MTNQALLRALKEYVNSDFVDNELNPRKQMAIEAIAEAEKQEQGDLSCPECVFGACHCKQDKVFVEGYGENSHSFVSIKKQEHGEPEGWIAVSDRLPLEEDGEVLVRMRDGRYEIAWANYWHGASNAFAQWTFRDPDEDETPTHWMKIAAAPQQRKPLTNEHIESLRDKYLYSVQGFIQGHTEFARAIEVAHGIKE